MSNSAISSGVGGWKTAAQTVNVTLSATDWLGTERARSDASNNLQATFCNLPFGDFLTTCQGTDPVPTGNTHFTGKEHDTESGNDYFGARYYASTMGRFLSPDPSGLGYADQTNPQSLNLYAYALNNPLKYIEPTGLYCYYGDADPSSADWGDNSQYDMHSTKGECTQKDENGNQGTWFDNPSTSVTVNGDGSSLTIDTTLPTSTAYITPVAQNARTALLRTLTNANPCWAFFNAATSNSGQNPPGIAFADTDIRLGPGIPAGAAAVSMQGSGSSGPIFLNPGSAFFNSTEVIDGVKNFVSIGPFSGGTLSAQEAILAHELGHKTNAIPSDRTSKGQSLLNTDTVLNYCKSQF